MSPNPPQTREGTDAGLKHALGVFQYSARAMSLVWTTNRSLTLVLVALTFAAGLLPAAIAYVGQLIVDGVIVATKSQLTADREAALWWVALEGGLVVVLRGIQRGLRLCDALLKAQLGHRVNVMILEKALTLELSRFEDAEFYDRLTRARRQASSRPLSLVRRTLDVGKHIISLVGYAGLLLTFSGWAVLIVAVAALPAFIAEARFAGRAFRLFSWRAPETRQQAYLETVIAREDYAKEVKIYGLGRRLLDRYRAIFESLYAEDRALTLRRSFWGYTLGLVSTLAFYGAYTWIAWTAMAGAITLGAMTMYLVVFRQGQNAFTALLAAVGGMYEDNLYLSELYTYLNHAEEDAPAGTEEAGLTEGPSPGDGVRFEGVSFIYPGATERALSDINLHLKPGQKLALVGENGSGKTTLIKLLTRLYTPTSGRILVDGLPIEDWRVDALRHRVAVVFQDFMRYQFTVGENIGAGDERRFDDAEGWAEAAERGQATPFIETLPEGFDTQLGRWFKGGRELSGGQWQKIALSRAFMRTEADILVLDEPTSAMDAEAESRLFEHLRQHATDKMAILISHRFSTVRMADHIVVLDQGRVLEQGDHVQLMQVGGTYARLFTLQAEGYQ
ncbi:MAG: ABC transporter ATP-binding protein [Bradymonadia bacterium]